MLYDAHNHLQDEWLQPFYSTIIPEIEGAEIGGAVVNGTTEEDWPRVAALAREHAWVIPSFGLHPWYLNQRSPEWQSHLVSAIDAFQGKPVGIGEIGLDRWLRDGPDFDLQKEIFRWQLRLAAERNLPASIHCLRAWGPLLEILEAEPLPKRGFLIHAYGGPREMVPQFAALGAYFSFSGAFLAPGKEKKLEPFEVVPPDRLLIETDAPAMPLPTQLNRFPLPLSEQGNPINHPANLVATFDGLAKRGDRERLASQLKENFRRLFLLWD